ncbi:hypothetical protein D6D12_09046 [Aureobasidium pullulans]|uniref:Uncharacterized protein n=1 Tax=Aureobasidium pullulans TaxID=5580 RepID=A0AB74JH82_AURPU|nr:hypothetical protein D6D12_09046 [Aureobasidium pullulans]
METSAQQDNTIKDTADSDAKDRATTDKVNMTEETTAKITNDDTLAVDKEKMAHDAFKTLFDTFREKVRLQQELFLVRSAAWQAKQAAKIAVDQHILDTRLDLQNIDLDRLQSLDDYSKFMTLDTTFIKRRTECYVLRRKHLELIDELVNLQMIIRRDHSDQLERADVGVKEWLKILGAHFLRLQRLRISR